MAYFDLPLAALQTYNPAEKSPADFDSFWKKTLAASAAFPLDPQYVPLDDPIYALVSAYDLTFTGYMGQRVKGWFIVPAGAKGKLPCVVSYIGYTGGRSLPVDHFAPVVAGFAHLVMDTRAQGGDTGDEGPCGPSIGGYMTRGILNRDDYFYRRLFTDAARAVDVARAHPLVDPARVCVTGGSQGGGIAIAAAGLAGTKVKLAMPDVPFLCHYTRATTLVDSMPYGEIAYYIKAHRADEAQVFKTLAYFDGIHFASRIKARCLFSVGLMDTICPPSTVYAAYNRIKGKKDIRVYTFNTHEGGGVVQTQERMRYAAKYL